MKKIFNKKSVLVTAIVLLLLVTVGGTLAYIFTQTPPVENTFTPSKVACAVVENGGTPVTGNTVNTGTSKDNVQIKNTGDTDAYIRVALVVTWKNANGNVWAKSPEPGKDYTLVTDLSGGWTYNDKDGYYYYSEAVAPSHLTSVLIKSCVQSGTAPEGYTLSVEIVASAIQAKGMGVTSAVDAWAEAAK